LTEAGEERLIEHMKVVRAAKLNLIPASHEDSESPGVLKKILFQRADFIDGRVQMINWSFLSRGKSFRSHYHEDMEEIFILVQGEARMSVDNEKVDLLKGDAVLVPLGSVHTMENVGKDDIEYIVVGVSKAGRGKTVVL
jgi:mannose-6-phosphate isomerase-like protein (cupin superfamily)